MSQWGAPSPQRVPFARQAGSVLLASLLPLPTSSRHACSARPAAFPGSLFRRGGHQTLPLSRALEVTPGLTSQLLQIRHAVYSVPAPAIGSKHCGWTMQVACFCSAVANGWWHHCTSGLGIWSSGEFPVDDAHDEGVHYRLGPDISWRCATT